MRALALVLAAALAGCGGVQRLQDDLREMQGLATIAGDVACDAWSGAPIVVAALRAPEHDGAPFAIADYELLFRPGRFSFVLEPGTYRLVAFVDEDRDLDYSAGERVAPWGGFADLALEAGARDGLDIAIEGPAPSIDERMPDVVHPTGESRSLWAGDVMPLESERFGAASGRMGVYEPTRFMRELGAGIFLLEPHDPARTPVLFVHGISGYPQEFDELVGALDRTRFEPWVAQYPSGWDLEVVADLFARVLNELHAVHRVERMCIVAHSMGGVVTRRTIARYVEQRDAPFVYGVVTIASPLGGHPGAGAGVVMSPIVVPAWRSLVPTGEFISHLYDAPLPEELRYALFFAFQDATGDGVVPLSSQLRVEAAREADVVRGFVGTHTGVLRDPATARAVVDELDRCRG